MAGGAGQPSGAGGAGFGGPAGNRGPNPGMPQPQQSNLNMANPMAQQPNLNMANPMAQGFQNAQNPVMYATTQPALAPQQFNAAIGMATPTGVVGPGQQGFQAPPSMNMANPMAQQQGASPNMAGLTLGSTPYYDGGSGSFGMASSPAGGGQQGQSQQDPAAALRAQMASYGPGFVSGVGGPDVSGNSPASQMGFDGSGSDGGVGGSPVPGRQSPMGGRPPMLSDFRQKQGLQVQGNPTSQQVGRGIGALGSRGRLR